MEEKSQIIWYCCNITILQIRILMYPCSTTTRAVLGNPSPSPNFPRPKRSQGSREIREIFRGRGFCTTRPEGFPEGEARGKSRGSRGAKPTAKENLEGGGDGFPNTSRVLVEHGHSLIITREGLIDNFILHTSYCALISPSSGSFLIQAGTLTMLLYK